MLLLTDRIIYTVLEVEYTCVCVYIYCVLTIDIMFSQKHESNENVFFLPTSTGSGCINELCFTRQYI